jgi:hypothetical protein
MYSLQTKERGQLESIVIRLEDVKKLLKILHLNLTAFGKVEPDLLVIFENIGFCDGGRGSIASLLDENFGLKLNESAYVNEDHFAR